MRKLLKYLALGALLVPSLAYAIAVPWNRPATGVITPLFTTDYVGLGTSTPKFPLQISSSTSAQLVLTDGSNTSPQWAFRAINDTLYISTSSPLDYSTTSTSHILTITKAGRVSIGQGAPATPSATLQLYEQNGTGASPSQVFGGNAAGDTDFWFARITNNDGLNNDTFQIGTSTVPGTNTPILTLDSMGDVGISSSSPYARFSIHANPTDNPQKTLFAVGSSTPTATTTLFAIDALGGFTVGTSTANFSNGLQLINNVLTAGSGIVITTAPGGITSGAGLRIAATSTAANEALTFAGKGTGSVYVDLAANGSFGLINTTNANTRWSWTNTTFSGSPSARAGVAAAAFSFSANADTSLPGGSEVTDVSFNLKRTKSHSTGNITLERDFLIQAPTETFAAGSANRTITETATLFVDAPPIGANALLTNSAALQIGSSTAGNTQNASTTVAYGLRIFAPLGAGTSYAASTTGKLIHSGLTETTAGTNYDVCLVIATGELVLDTTGTCIVSSKRFKHDIQTLQVDALSLLMRLRPVSFTPNDPDSADYQDRDYSFIAEEVAAVDPHLARYGTDGLPRTIDDHALLALTAAAVQDLAKGSVTITYQAVRSAEENWQNGLIALLFLCILYQGVQIKRIKKLL